MVFQEGITRDLKYARRSESILTDIHQPAKHRPILDHAVGAADRDLRSLFNRPLHALLLNILKLPAEFGVAFTYVLSGIHT